MYTLEATEFYLCYKKQCMARVRWFNCLWFLLNVVHYITLEHSAFYLFAHPVSRFVLEREAEM